MGVELTLLHALYILCLLTIITFFIFRKDTTIICIVFIFLLALTATSSIPLAISGIFQSFIYAITELLPTILIISIIVSMSNLLVHTGINDTMISPFTKMIRTPAHRLLDYRSFNDDNFLFLLAFSSCRLNGGYFITSRCTRRPSANWSRHRYELIRTRHRLIW